MSDAEALAMFRIGYYNCSKRCIAISCGFSQSYLDKLERGFLPVTVSVIRKLAGFYNVSSIKLTRFFRELAEYDLSKPVDYQKALAKISTFFVENRLDDN